MSTTNQLVWTNEKPTKIGFYWWKNSHRTEKIIIELQSDSCWYEPGNEVEILDFEIDDQFAGPITEPISENQELNDLHAALQTADGMLTLYHEGSAERKFVHDTRLKYFRKDNERNGRMPKK